GLGGTVAFNRSDDVTFARFVTDGTVRQIGSGTLTLSSGFNLQGFTAIDNGTLATGSDGNLGRPQGNLGNLAGMSLGGTATGGTLKYLAGFNSARAVTLNAGGGTFDTNGFDAALSGAIAGPGGLTKAGAGTLTLAGPISYTGATSVTGGTLAIAGGASVSSSGGVSVAAGATFDVSAMDSFLVNVNSIDGAGNIALGRHRLVVTGRDFTTVSGTISGVGGALHKAGRGGVLTLTGNNTYDDGTIIEGGLVAITSDASLGAPTGELVIGGGILQFLGGFDLAPTREIVAALNGATFNTNGFDSTISQGISGIGGLIKDGGGTLTLLGTNTYTGGTTVNGGVLRIGTGGSLPTTGSITINGGKLHLDNGGNGMLTLLSLSGSGGELDLGGNSLNLLQDVDTTYGGSLTGGGGLIKAGIGTLILNGTNTYTGPTTVSGGRLSVNGSITSNVTVAPGASLGGNGTITGAVTVGGAFAPGNSIGTLNVSGSVIQSTGSSYQVELDASGQSDRINVTGAPGTATIEPGATVTALPAGGAYGRSTTYTILNATGGISGTYAGVSLPDRAFLAPSLSYDANNVFLTVDVSFARGAQTPNQAAVASALDQANAGSMSSDMAGVISAMSGLGTAQGPQALAALSGQSYAGFATVAVQGAQSFMNAFTQQAGGGQGGGRIALAEACDSTCEIEGARWGAWGGGVGAFGTVAGNANANGLTYTLGGFAAGLDYRFAPDFTAGIAVGYNAATLYPQGTSGQGNVGTVQVGLYGQYKAGNGYLDALAGYARSDNRSMRQIIIPGLNLRTAWGQTTADQFFGQLEAGYKLVIAPAFGGFVTPFARLQASTSTQAGFTETGADSLNLSVAQQTTNSLRTVLGAQLGASIDAGWRDKLNLTFRLGWSHEFADTNRPVSAAFAGAPAFTFTTQGATAPRDGVVLGLGATTAVGAATSLYVRYDGDLAGANTNHVLSAGVRYVW
ncbi:MAG TPA: autotransporter domain-containing protein, partial [Reyranella sp.]|nr:autotransporter domain-containing protein [Reyranella sp.]